MNIDKVKDHFKRNKQAYIFGAAGLLVGAAGIILFSEKIKVTQIAIGKDINQIQITEVHLARRGHPGNVIKCDQTGEVFASQNRAASVNGISSGGLSEHLNGLRSDVNGLTFTKLGEAE